MVEIRKRVGAVVAGAAVVFAVIAPVATAAPMATQQSTTAAQSIDAAGDGTPAGAVAWYSAHNGSTGWEGMCEMAAENSYGTTGIWSTANAHWEGASEHPGDMNPPLGAFVYWNISQWGHVGISDGAGGFWASSVNGAIGHVTKADGSYNFFDNYRGWTPAARPSQ